MTAAHLKAVCISIMTSAYEYAMLIEKQSPIYSHVSLDKTKDIYLSLEDLVADFNHDVKVNKIIVKALKDTEVIANSVLDINLNVTVEKKKEFLTVNKSYIDDDNSINGVTQYAVSSESLSQIDHSRETVTIFALPISESNMNKCVWR